MLGPVTLTRAWYHCADCGHGFAPRDAELGVAGQSMSPGLAVMTDLAAAAGPFAKASRMLQTMAGVRLTAKRAESLVYQDVAQAYLNLLTLQNEISIRQAIAKSTGDRIGQLEHWVRIGRSRESEVLAAKSQLAQFDEGSHRPLAR